MARLLCVIGFLGHSATCISALPGSSPREIEITAIDLESSWKSTSDRTFPKEAIKAYPAGERLFLADGPTDFVAVDLDGDGQAELIVTSRYGSGSGGTSYFILRKAGKVWRLIGEMQGGFVLSLEDSKSKFYRIKSYYRSGETYQHTYDYRNGRYERTGEVLIPRVISRSSWWHPLWLRLNGHPGPGDGNPPLAGQIPPPLATSNSPTSLSD
jgi:hypothetical protein